MLARVLLNGEASRQKRKREKKNVTEKADCVWILCIIGYGLRELCGCGFVWAYKSNNRECDENVPLTPLTAHTHSERASNSECERANKQNTRRTNEKISRDRSTRCTGASVLVIVVAILLLLFIFIKYISLSCCNFIKT